MVLYKPTNSTLTYGTTCAPYLAIRTIQQLARDEGEHYPLAASVTIRDIYMDDILTGSSDFQEFQKLQLELISLFKKAGMSLHKWCSNTPEILNSIPKEEQSWDFHCQSSDQKTIKTLGIIWSPQFDYFSFKTVVNCRESYTKREVLSIIARLFDPLGFLGPILTKAKLILQKLWVLKLEWDEPLSNPIAKEWNDFVSTLPVIQNIHVPRLVIGKGRIIIHGFADASTAAYGAVLYAQSISEEDVSTRLLCSKSCVAPVKPITIPRLELCACVLLSQLLEKVLHSLTLPIQQIMLWTDSNIVLAWIQRSPEQLKTFIGNRIKIIQRLTQNCQWNHVSSNENSADLISRGLNASDISSKQLWFFHNSRNPSVKRSGQLDYSEVNEAELCLIKNLQASAFQEGIEFLAKSSCNSKKASKAVHLEIVSDLTTDAFLATLKRFVARRGKCATISSENAKNFVGANRELKRLHNLLKFPEEKLSSYLSSEGISWNFMPPRAPNFGGLWEAGIEGILNSRPITPLSEDIDDLEVLTPGHFLIGRPITSISEPNLLDKTENTLSLWQKLTKIVQHIWTKWSRDYLNNLQQRNKWQFHKDNVKLNTMVLIKDDNLPVNKWSLGRITKLVPGTDGKVPVVEIKTNKGNIKRSIGKVCVLPLDN
ncbi:uncharacterized protein TNCV_1506531 [Trichonephila clavipes]|nr:uncharacterized protein TNCV_1506531 [Trichonephila clavipes]